MVIVCDLQTKYLCHSNKMNQKFDGKNRKLNSCKITLYEIMLQVTNFIYLDMTIWVYDII